jgi:precorrin-6A/cobalt-precorrin-6A reductase
VADEAEAKALIPPEAIVFLATGRQSLPAWEGLRAKAVHLRVIDPPTGPFPFAGGLVVARPPLRPGSTRRRFSDGSASLTSSSRTPAPPKRDPKLDAAPRPRHRGLVSAARPLPAGLSTVATVEEALAWAVALSFSPA